MKQTMKALVLEKVNQLIYQDVPIPEYGDNDLLIRVKSCGICGSDVHGMDGSTDRRRPPIIMGHEASGTIAEVGSGIHQWQKGDRVTFDSTIYPLEDWYTRKGMYNLSDNRMVLGVSCEDYRRHGAFAEFVTVPEHILYHIPDKVSFDQAAMVEPAAVAFHALELTPFSLNDSAVVVGTGVIGLFIIQALRIAGCGKIFAVDVDEERLTMAYKFGADILLNPSKVNVVERVLERTSQRGADVVLEAVGIDETIETAVNCLRKGGTLTLVGNVAPRINLALQSIVTRQIRLQGSCAIAGEYPAVLGMIERGILNVDDVLSASIPLSEGVTWFQRLYQKEKGLLKVVLNP